MSEEKKTLWQKLKSGCSRVLASLTGRVIFELARWAFGVISVSALGALGLPLIRASWQVKISAFAILGSVVVLIYLILRSHRRRKKELLHFKSIVESCGIEGFWPFTTQQEKESGWKDCTTKMSDSKWGEICIAGLTGAHTFADDGAPLYSALREHRGDIRILLIRKDSRAFHQRVAEMAGDDAAKAENLKDEYRLRIDRALRFCMRLGEQGTERLRSIEVRAYDRPAIWKMVIFGNYLWLQHYVAGKPASDMPAYVFRREHTDSMTPPLERVFEFRWKWGESMVLLHRDRNGEWKVRPDLSAPAAAA